MNLTTTSPTPSRWLILNSEVPEPAFRCAMGPHPAILSPAECRAARWRDIGVPPPRRVHLRRFGPHLISHFPSLAGLVPACDASSICKSLPTSVVHDVWLQSLAYVVPSHIKRRSPHSFIVGLQTGLCCNYSWAVPTHRSPECQSSSTNWIRHNIACGVDYLSTGSTSPTKALQSIQTDDSFRTLCHQDRESPANRKAWCEKDPQQFDHFKFCKFKLRAHHPLPPWCNTSGRVALSSPIRCS